MSWSLNEVEALARKAARGAGLSWGLAEEAGRATRWLIAHGLPGAEVLSAALTRLDGLPHDAVAPLDGWQARDVLCPITTGAALADLGAAGGGDLRLGPVAGPLLLLPFIAPHVVTLSWDGVRLGMRDEAVILGGAPDGVRAAIAQSVRIETGPAEGRALPLQDRAELDAETVSRLDAFAQRTYAPATEASRIAGAGAGLADND
ncbi:MAG: DUF3726 domain-containing protein [Limimaricola sp.]|uniref:DUF3726 domain-containing protein n=1 Tax=Limimaricola sp. TaxID=2211665 RepID=UPI001D60A037|nr:DUF3726 domain-containing protein [Limimaricola sp.]MBI1416250.1 DUF3726 domain-containing protein [Limimaricola sp.]